MNRNLTPDPPRRSAPAHRLPSLRALPALSVLTVATGAAAVPVATPVSGGPATRAEARWTNETPDLMVDDAVARALAAGATKSAEADRVAAALTVDALADRALYGHAQKALKEIAAGAGPELAGEITLLARTLAPDLGSAAGVAADAALGVVTTQSILGPFRDTGGGLEARDGPESPGSGFAATSQAFSWGSVEVKWRSVPPPYATAKGVPLDLFIHPRKESCTWVATKLTAAAGARYDVRLAASGSARLVIDGVTVAKSDDVNASAKLDRLAVSLTPGAGPHVVAAKVCTGALDDDGRVRLRVLPEGVAPPPSLSAELAGTPRLDHAPPAWRLERAKTPLERVLAQGAGPGDLPLDVVVARTLGGADDLKSPRAPGLLDLVGRDKGATADRLAMAGWVAPSGANRSAWLNRAAELGEAGKEKDPRARAFALRRLVAQRARGRLADWAIATARAAGIGSLDPEGVLINAVLEEALGTEALRLSAMRRLAAAVDAAPAAVPTALLLQLAPLAEALDPARHLAVHRILAKRGIGAADLALASASQDQKTLVTAATEAFDGGLDDADDGVAVASLLSRNGAHEAARRAFMALVAFAPNRADAWSGLAEELALSGPQGPDPAAEARAAAALERAREISPAESRYKAEFALRSKEGKGGPVEGYRDDERYLVPSETILARRQGAPAKGAPDVADRQLYWLRAVVMHPDRRVSQLIQYAREIVIAPRTEDELVEDLPAEAELTEILKARVHRKDGGTAFPTEEHHEGARPRVRWPDLSPGDVVEVALRQWTSGAVGGRGDPPFDFLDYAGSTLTHPLLYNEVVVEASPQTPVYLDVLHGQPDRRIDKDEGSRHVTRLIWDKPVAIADEPLAPALTETVPMIVGSTFKSWADFRSWYVEAVRDFTVPDEEIKRIAAELTQGKTTQKAKLEALFEFVADDIRYVNFVSGEWYLPNRPQQLLARREGDCDDKAILLITLLRAVGIDAEEVMVQTRLTNEPSLLLAKNVAVPRFDHGIAFLPGPNGGTYLDATSPESRLGPLPSMDARALGLKVNAGPAEIVQLPAGSPDEHGSDVGWTITLHPDGSGDLVGEERHSGDSAFWLRTSAGQPDARAQYVEDNLLAPYLPTVVVDKEIDYKADLPAGQAWVKYKAHSDGMARMEQEQLVVPLTRAMSYATLLAPLLVRTLPVSLPPQLAPSHRARTSRILAPPGYHFDEVPMGGDENGGSFGRAHLEISRDKNDPRALVVKSVVLFDASWIPVDRYSAFREWLQRVDRLLRKTARLSRDEGAAAAAKGAR